MKSSAHDLASRRSFISTGLCACAAVTLARAPRAADGAARLPLISKPIPSSGEQLPVVGLGTNNFNVSEAPEVAARREVLQKMPEMGGKVVDTAPLYGASEALIGELVAGLGNRGKLFLATKVMARDAAQGTAMMEESLRRLRVATIDLMQVHNLMGVEVLLPVLREWKQARKIRYFGITTSNQAAHAQMMQYMQKNPLDFIQVDYSIGNRAAADAVLPMAHEKGIGVVINSPFGGRRGANFLAQTAGWPLPDWAGEIDATSWAQIFLKYVVSHPAVTCAIPGTTSAVHLADNQRGGHGRLPDAAQRRRMEQYWDSKSVS